MMQQQCHDDRRVPVGTPELCASKTETHLEAAERRLAGNSGADTHAVVLRSPRPREIKCGNQDVERHVVGCVVALKSWIFGN